MLMLEADLVHCGAGGTLPPAQQLTPAPSDPSVMDQLPSASHRDGLDLCRAVPGHRAHPALATVSAHSCYHLCHPEIFLISVLKILKIYYSIMNDDEINLNSTWLILGNFR